MVANGVYSEVAGGRVGGNACGRRGNGRVIRAGGSGAGGLRRAVEGDRDIHRIAQRETVCDRRRAGIAFGGSPAGEGKNGRVVVGYSTSARPAAHGATR